MPVRQVSVEHAPEHLDFVPVDAPELSTNVGFHGDRDEVPRERRERRIARPGWHVPPNRGPGQCSSRPDKTRNRVADHPAARVVVDGGVDREPGVHSEELEQIGRFDYVVINEQAPPERRDALPAVDDLEAIVRAERFRIHHYDDVQFTNVENA